MKVWALKQGVDSVQKFSHLIFLDADIILKENIVIKTLSFMKYRTFMLSLMAKLKCKQFGKFF